MLAVTNTSVHIIMPFKSLITSFMNCVYVRFILMFCRLDPQLKVCMPPLTYNDAQLHGLSKSALPEPWMLIDNFTVMEDIFG